MGQFTRLIPTAFELSVLTSQELALTTFINNCLLSSGYEPINNDDVCDRKKLRFISCRLFKFATFSLQSDCFKYTTKMLKLAHFKGRSTYYKLGHFQIATIIFRE